MADFNRCISDSSNSWSTSSLTSSLPVILPPTLIRSCLDSFITSVWNILRYHCCILSFQTFLFSIRAPKRPLIFLILLFFLVDFTSFQIKFYHYNHPPINTRHSLAPLSLPHSFGRFIILILSASSMSATLKLKLSGAKQMPHWLEVRSRPLILQGNHTRSFSKD